MLTHTLLKGEIIVVSDRGNERKTISASKQRGWEHKWDAEPSPQHKTQQQRSALLIFIDCTGGAHLKVFAIIAKVIPGVQRAFSWLLVYKRTTTTEKEKEKLTIQQTFSLALGDNNCLCSGISFFYYVAMLCCRMTHQLQLYRCSSQLLPLITSQICGTTPGIFLNERRLSNKKHAHYVMLFGMCFLFQNWKANRYLR